MIELDDLRHSFDFLYKSTPRFFRAPGRVNLIGEHTDYNDGFVLPIAINRETVIAGASREDRIINVCSLDVNEQYEYDLDNPAPSPQGSWLNYVKGVSQSLQNAGAKLRGANLLIKSDVPIGAGLSSSAALEIAVGFALLNLSDIEVDRLQLAKAGQKAEHDYVGAKVGIMDQLAATFGQKGAALLIDCRSLETTAIPFRHPNLSIVVCDTNIKHELAASEYNLRRQQCEQGVEILKNDLPHITALRDVSVEDFRRYESALPEPIRRRCRHVITENARTREAAHCLQQDNLSEMGQLMYQSHQSLRDDYEVSCRELDILVDIAAKCDGVLGARMTGGGFGGCTVNLVDSEKVEEFCDTVLQDYPQYTKLTPTIYVVDTNDGASEIG